MIMFKGFYLPSLHSVSLCGVLERSNASNHVAKKVLLWYRPQTTLKNRFTVVTHKNNQLNFGFQNWWTYQLKSTSSWLLKITLKSCQSTRNLFFIFFEFSSFDCCMLSIGFTSIRCKLTMSIRNSLYLFDADRYFIASFFWLRYHTSLP